MARRKTRREISDLSPLRGLLRALAPSRSPRIPLALRGSGDSWMENTRLERPTQVRSDDDLGEARVGPAAPDRTLLAKRLRPQCVRRRRLFELFPILCAAASLVA